jgi:hypothetical protein
LWSATAATVVSMTAFGVVSSGVAAQAASHTSSNPVGPGYPPPGGIYAPFTNCPILNPLMQESLSGDITGCVAGDGVSGTIKIGNLTTAVVHPVTAQFGIWSPPNASPNQLSGGVLPPPAGLGAELVTSPELVPGGLLQALGCSTATIGVIKTLCREAANYGGSYLDVFASAQEALPVTNFGLTTWTQPIKIQLINPLLGSNCYIGSDDNPIVVNPAITGGTLNVLTDPNPTKHPNTVVLEILGGTASDNTFAAPVLTGCGPGGSANIPVDEQLDSYAGLPAASGSNILSLSGNFYVADCYFSKNQAKILLSAFLASVGTPPAGAPGKGLSQVTSASLSGRYGIR